MHTNMENDIRVDIVCRVYRLENKNLHDPKYLAPSDLCYRWR